MPTKLPSPSGAGVNSSDPKTGADKSAAQKPGEGARGTEAGSAAPKQQATQTSETEESQDRAGGQQSKKLGAQSPDGGKTRGAQASGGEGRQKGSRSASDYGFYRQHLDRLNEVLEAAEEQKGSGTSGADLSRQWREHFGLHQGLAMALQEMGAGDPDDDTDYQGDLVGMLLDERAPQTTARDRLKLAGTLIREIIEREENPKTGLLAKARQEGIPEPVLERRIAACMADQGGRPMRKRQPMAHQEDDMPRDYDTPDRDDRGRFTSDDDRGGSRSSRGYDEDDRRSSRGYDDERGGYGRGSNQYSRGGYDDDNRSGSRSRDEDGRYMSRGGNDYDDDRRSSSGGSGSRSRDDDGRFTSGGGSRSSRDYDDDDRRSPSGNGSRSRDEDGRFTSGGGSRSSRGYDDDNRSSGGSRPRDEDGRFTSGGGSRSSRSGDDDDRRSSSRGGRDEDGRGWYGDSQGHSEAARRGWEGRDDDRSNRSMGGGGSRSSRSSSDDDRRSSSSRGGSDEDGRGWHGDSKGHAEAARRGWENRDDDRSSSSRNRR